MPTFRLGDRVQYNLLSRPIPGVVTHVGAFIGVTLEAPLSGSRRAFDLNGAACHGHLGYQAPDGGTTITLIEQEPETMNLEYPPEPKIGYGPFTSNGAAVSPGYTGQDVIVGYGILHTPPNFYSPTFSELDSYRERDLNDFLALAKEKWQAECRKIDWQRVDNKWEALIGCKVRYFNFYGDEIVMMVLPPDHGRWYDLNVMYRTTAVVPGISEASVINASLNSEGASIVSVDGDVITNHDGVQWAAVPRFLHLTDQPPEWVMSPTLQTHLMRNLDTVRAAKDSQPIAA